MEKSIHLERIKTLQALSVQPIQSQDHIVHAAQKILIPLAINMLEVESECREDRSIDGLRKYRESVLRLRAILLLLDDYLPKKARKRFNKRTRKLLRRIDDVYKLDLLMRDLLVHGEGAANRMAVAGIIAQLDGQRLLAKNKLFDYLNSKKYRKFLDRLEKYLQHSFEEIFDLEDESPTHPHQLKHVLPALLYEHLAIVRAKALHPDALVMWGYAEEVAEFFFLLELFAPVLGDEIRSYVDAFEGFHIRLMHIAEVEQILDELIHFPRTNLDSSQFLSLKNYRRRLQARLEASQQEFPDIWESFNQQDAREALAHAVAAL